jgi:hypothetical protein
VRLLAGPHPQRHITAGATEEIKLDGYQAEAVRPESGVILFSRSRKSFNKQFSLIVEALADLPENTVIDGEVVALDESGRPDFNLLQNFRSDASRIHFFVFGHSRALDPLVDPTSAIAQRIGDGRYRFSLPKTFQGPNPILPLRLFHRWLLSGSAIDAERKLGLSRMLCQLKMHHVVAHLPAHDVAALVTL